MCAPSRFGSRRRSGFRASLFVSLRASLFASFLAGFLASGCGFLGHFFLFRLADQLGFRRRFASRRRGKQRLQLCFRDRRGDADHHPVGVVKDSDVEGNRHLLDMDPLIDLEWGRVHHDVRWDLPGQTLDVELAHVVLENAPFGHTHRRPVSDGHRHADADRLVHRYLEEVRVQDRPGHRIQLVVPQHRGPLHLPAALRNAQIKESVGAGLRMKHLADLGRIDRQADALTLPVEDTRNLALPP